MRRVVVFNKENKAVGVYESIDKVSSALGIDKNNIMFNLRGQGNKFIKGYRFEWEITNKELREARLRDRKNRQAQKQKKLEKEFHIK